MINNERKLRENRLIWAMLFFMCIGVALLFDGCATTKAQDTLECRDGHLYSVNPQKVELMLQDSCDKGKIEMRGE